MPGKPARFTYSASDMTSDFISPDSIEAPVGAPAPPPQAAALSQRLLPHDYAPRVIPTRDGSAPLLDLDTYAGRYTLLAFLGSTELPDYAVLKKTLEAAQGIFSQPQAQFVGIGMDVEAGQPYGPDVRVEMIRDPEMRIAAAYGALQPGSNGTGEFTPLWMIIDPAGRVRDILPLGRPDKAFETYMSVLKAATLFYRRNLPMLEQSHVLESDLCLALIEECTPNLKVFPGITGVSVASLTDTAQVRVVMQRIERRLIPGVRTAFDFPAKTIENLVFVKRSATPDARVERLRIRAQPAMRDKAVMAVWLPLDDFVHRGGTVSFPEYAERPVEVAKGAALVHSGQILRQVNPVDSMHRHYLELLIKG